MEKQPGNENMQQNIGAKFKLLRNIGSETFNGFLLYFKLNYFFKIKLFKYFC